MVRVSLGAVALLALSGCTGQTADIPEIESRVAARLLEDVGVAARVDCPDAVKWEEAETFRCDVSWDDGDQGQVAIKMMEDGEYSYEYPA